MSDQFIETGIDRRDFIRAVAATAVAATAIGAGATLLLNERTNPAAVVPSPAITSPNPIADIAGGGATRFHSELVSVRAENVRLQALLNATQRQLELARMPAPDVEDNSVDWQMRLEEANAQVTNFGEQIGVLSGLISLYEQLEAVDIAQVAEDGLSSVGDALGNLMDEVPAVREGLRLGQAAVIEFEEELSRLDIGRRWLTTRIDRIAGAHNAIESALENGVRRTGTFLQNLNEWFTDILKWLPFGIGDNASRIMNAIAILLEQTPETIAGLQDQIAQPLDRWFELDDGQTRLKRRLIKPVRDEALTRSEQTVTQLEAFNVGYRARLVQPIELVTERQRALQKQIAEYRQGHQV